MIIIRGGTQIRQQHDIAAALARWQDYKGKKERMMALTRNFKETLRARVERDPKFKKELLREGIASMIEGDAATAKTILRDYINATVGFTELAEATHIPPGA